jgi:hypothetical protein
VPGAAKKLEPAVNVGPDQSCVQGLPLGRRNNVVPVPVRDQERGSAGRHPRQQAQLAAPVGGVGNVRDAQQAGLEGKRQKMGLMRSDWPNQWTTAWTALD